MVIAVASNEIGVVSCGCAYVGVSAFGDVVSYHHAISIDAVRGYIFSCSPA